MSLDGTVLTTHDAARLLRLSPDTLRQWRRRRCGAGPRFVRLNSGGPKPRIRYLIDDLAAWLRTNTVQDAHECSRRG